MDTSVSELKNEMRCATKFYNRLSKTVPGRVMLMKGAYKDKRFDGSTIFRIHDDFK